MKTNTAEETTSSDEDNESITFINFNCVKLCRDDIGATEILDVGASSHMAPHLNLLVDYQMFVKPRII